MGEKVFTLRINEDLFERVKQAAEENRRSIAKEIENCLFWQYQGYDDENTIYNEEIDGLIRKAITIYNQEIHNRKKK